MDVFISWSGDRSKAVAAALKLFLSAVNQEWQPWVSHEDIAVGKRWRPALAESLRKATWAVVCVTPAAMKSAWVQFETGALSVSCERICPYLIDIKSKQPSGPLSDFQARDATRSGTLDLVMGLNDTSSQPLHLAELERRFASSWPDLEAGIRNAPEELAAPDHNRLDEEGLRNLLSLHFGASADRLTRVFQRNFAQVEKAPNRAKLEMLVIETMSAIREGRRLLEPFHADGIGNLPKFLNEKLSESDLKERLKRGIKLILEFNERERSGKVDELIRSEQNDLMQKIREHLDTLGN